MGKKSDGTLSPERARRVGTILTISLIGVVALGALAGRSWLRSRVSGHERAPVVVAFNWPLTRTADGRAVNWMDPSTQRSLERVARLNLTSDPLDYTALKLTADALYATGWFEGMPTVSRQPGGAVHVVGSWRAPVAVVRTAGKDMVISAKGELLPLTYATGTSGLKYIEGAFAPPPERYGGVWSGGDVEAALALLGLLQDTSAEAQVAGIDVARYVSNKRLVIVTDRGNRVVWGASPLDWSPAEPTRQVKLQRLLALRADAKFGWRIDADQAVIDLTNPRGVIVDRSASGMAGAGQHLPTFEGASESTDQASANRR